MSNNIHGHEVMEMMVNSQKSYTRETLEKEIIDTFGKEARFYTCSAENMTASQLIDFLEQRGKFIASDSGFSTTKDHICSGHDDHDH